MHKCCIYITFVYNSVQCDINLFFNGTVNLKYPIY